MAKNRKFRPKSFFCLQQSRKRIVKVPENRPGRFSKTPENLPVISRAIFKATEDFAFEKKALWLARIMAKSLKFVLELYFCSLYSKKFLLESSYRTKCLRAPASLVPSPPPDIRAEIDFGFGSCVRARGPFA